MKSEVTLIEEEPDHNFLLQQAEAENSQLNKDLKESVKREYDLNSKLKYLRVSIHTH
jgi:hypothetical protein